MSGFSLEADARLALEVACGTAGAMGDEHCGTEHLLFGLTATAVDEFAELTELFALDVTRVERALVALRAHRCSADDDDVPVPGLSTRAEVALVSTPLAGEGGLGAFDLLAAVLGDPRSGATAILRTLGVRIGDIRGLAELGAARLGRDEVEELMAVLDRRSDTHQPWWGPPDDGRLAWIDLSDARRRLLGRSETAVATLDRVVAGREGFGLTITITSCDDWLLPPRWEPDEELIPGVGSANRREPDVVSIDLQLGDDGRVVSNRTPLTRWRADEPQPGALVRLGSRSVVDERNDRRRATRRAETSEWWVWPLPERGPIEIRLDWPAEALNGVLALDADEIRGASVSLGERRSG